MATATIEVDEKVAAALRAQAEALHIPLSQFLEKIALGSELGKAPPALTDEEFENLIDSVSGNDPVLPPDFSRADIYADHD